MPNVASDGLLNADGGAISAILEGNPPDTQGQQCRRGRRARLTHADHQALPEGAMSGARRIIRADRWFAAQQRMLAELPWR